MLITSPTKRSSVSSSDTNSTRRRTTVGTRIGGGRQNSSSQENQNSTPTKQQEQSADVEQIAELLKECMQPQQQKEEENGTGGGGNIGGGGTRGGPAKWQHHQRDEEICFFPPWETKIGQMQQVVRMLQRHAYVVVENRGSIIIRCYPYKSATYMHLVYNLIYATLASAQQFGPMQAPTEIRPILLHYDNTNGSVNPEHHPPAPFANIPQFTQQPAWTDVVLIRVRFANQEPAMCFLQTFNRTVGRVFDRRQVRAPFAHPDLSQPERVLRHRLQQICVEKNGGGRFPRSYQRNNRYNNNMRHRAFYRSPPQQDVRYFHNGLQIYKEFLSGRTEPVYFEEFTELQCLHVVVASLRKYAPLFVQKDSSVVVQNLDEDVLTDADTERITAVVYSVVATDIYRKRFETLQQAKIRRQQNNPASATNVTSMDSGIPKMPSSTVGSVSSQTGEFLPVKIERIPRRNPPPTTAQTGGGAWRRNVGMMATNNTNNSQNNGNNDANAKTASPQQSPQKKTEKKEDGNGEDGLQSESEQQPEKQQPQEEGEEKPANGSEAGDGGKQEQELPQQQQQEPLPPPRPERPPLVRIQFRSKEAALAFVQVFKECQRNERLKHEAAADTADSEEECGRRAASNSPANSFSDLSDLEVFTSSSCDDEEAKEGEDGNKKKKAGKKQRRRKRNQPRVYFPNAFAHRDLTPPELALGYQLRQYCRERNGQIQTTTETATTANEPTTSASAASTSKNVVLPPSSPPPQQQQYPHHRRFYTRVGRIYQRRNGGGGGGNGNGNGGNSSQSGRGGKP